VLGRPRSGRRESEAIAARLAAQYRQRSCAHEAAPSSTQKH
jgi:hypothetical protein